MLVLVTGATGRIGSHLTRSLVEAGHTVRALVVPGDPRAAALDGLGVEQVAGRLESPEAVTTAARDVTAVYHLGGGVDLAREYGRGVLRIQRPGHLQPPDGGAR